MDAATATFNLQRFTRAGAERNAATQSPMYVPDGEA